MAKRVGRSRRKTRQIMSKHAREKGKISLSSYFQEFKEGDNVNLQAEPAMHKGMYFRRFHGKQGVIKGKRGGCYEVMLKDGGKQKMLIIHPVHLRKV